MANHGHDVTMPAGPGAQNAKTILGVVVGHSLDEARQHFLGQWFRLRKTYADYPRSRSVAKDLALGPWLRPRHSVMGNAIPWSPMQYRRG